MAQSPRPVSSQSIRPNSSGTIYLPLIDKSVTEEDWIGPYGGKIVSLAISRSNPQVLYAGTWGSGVFTTTDGGNHWAPANQGLGALQIQSLAVDPTNTQIAYAGTYKSGIYKTTNGGASWSAINNGIQAQAIVYALSVNPSSPNILFASTRGISNNGSQPWRGVIYRSDNQGASWTAVLTNVGGSDFQDWAYSLVINPGYTNWIFAGLHQHGPVRSTDGGWSWEAKGNGSSMLSRGMALSNLTNTVTLYLAGWTTCDNFICDTRGGVYKSSDAAENWTPKLSGVYGLNGYAISIDPTNPQTVYLGTQPDGMRKTTNGGESWSTINNGLPAGASIYAVVNHPQTANPIYVATDTDGIFKSSNGGASWSASNQGLAGNPITAVVSRPNNFNQLFASLYNGGVFRSDDDGQTWSEITGALATQGVHNLAFSPANPNLLFALTDSGGVYRLDLSSGSGGWTPENEGIPAMGEAYQTAYDAEHPFASQSMTEDDLLNLEENPDSYLQALSISSKPLLSMSFAVSNPQIAYLSTAGAGLLRSDNGGASWKAAGLDELTVYQTAVAANNPQQVFAATSAQPSLRTSGDGGQSWQSIDLGGSVTAYTVSASPVEPGVIYAGTNQGVYRRSADGSWQTAGLSGHTITVVYADPGQANTVYAGAESGIYASGNGGVSWTLLSANTNGLVIQSFSYGVDSTRGLTRYLIGTQTRGLLRIEIH